MAEAQTQEGTELIRFGDVGGEGGESGKAPDSTEAPGEHVEQEATVATGEDEQGQVGDGEFDDVLFGGNQESSDHEEEHRKTDDGKEWVPKSRFDYKVEQARELREQISEQDATIQGLRSQLDSKGNDLGIDFKDIFPDIDTSNPEHVRRRLLEDGKFLQVLSKNQSSPQIRAALRFLEEQGAFDVNSQAVLNRDEKQGKSANADPKFERLEKLWTAQLSSNIQDVLQRAGVRDELRPMLTDRLQSRLSEAEDASGKAIVGELANVIREEGWSREFVKVSKATKPSTTGGVPPAEKTTPKRVGEKSDTKDEGPKTPSDGVRERGSLWRSLQEEHGGQIEIM